MVVVRFAPSPTGNLHIGSVRTALFNWLFARKNKGLFLLRIEDTDLQRSTKPYEINILEGLKWLGLNWDKGPDMEGDEVKYRQSERIAQHVYDRYIQQLIDQQDAYYCYCTPEELEKERQDGNQSGYSGRCRHLTSQQQADFETSGRPRTVRFKIRPEQLIVHDLIRGEVTFDTALISDLIIQKADGAPAYNFAVVVDDIEMGITHVIRGEDHLPNTPKQIQIYVALGAKLPFFAHLPMILGPDKSKLSKRHGATSVVEYQQQGFLPQAITNYLSLLGWSHPEGKEKMPTEEIVEHFYLERISKSGAVFDVEKLTWLNGLYLRELPEEKLYLELYPLLLEAYPEPMSRVDQVWVKSLIETIKDHLHLTVDVVEAAKVFFLEPVFDEVLLDKFVRDDLSRAIISDLYQSILSLDHYDELRLHDLINELPAKFTCGKGKVLKPLRIAITGMDHGPALVKIFFLLGKDTVLKRLGARMYAK